MTNYSSFNSTTWLKNFSEMFKQHSEQKSISFSDVQKILNVCIDDTRWIHKPRLVRCKHAIYLKLDELIQKHKNKKNYVKYFNEVKLKLQCAEKGLVYIKKNTCIGKSVDEMNLSEKYFNKVKLKLQCAEKGLVYIKKNTCIGKSVEEMNLSEKGKEGCKIMSICNLLPKGSAKTTLNRIRVIPFEFKSEEIKSETKEFERLYGDSQLEKEEFEKLYEDSQIKSETKEFERLYGDSQFETEEFEKLYEDSQIKSETKEFERLYGDSQFETEEFERLYEDSQIKSETREFERLYGDIESKLETKKFKRLYSESKLETAEFERFHGDSKSENEEVENNQFKYTKKMDLSRLSQDFSSIVNIYPIVCRL